MITALALHTDFDLMLDKYGSPYFADDEKDLIINKAIREVVKDIFYNLDVDKAANGQARVGYEVNKVISSYLSDLVTEISGTQATAGEITDAEINTLVEAQTYVGATYLYPLALSLSQTGLADFYTAKFQRANEVQPFRRNAYLKPDFCRVYYRLLDGKIGIEPNNVIHDFEMAVLRNPRLIELGVTDTDLNPTLQERVINKAEEYASISIRDPQLYQTVVGGSPKA